jgi:hypothetical protein
LPERAGRLRALRGGIRRAGLASPALFESPVCRPQGGRRRAPRARAAKRRGTKQKKHRLCDAVPIRRPAKLGFRISDCCPLADSPARRGRALQSRTTRASGATPGRRRPDRRDRYPSVGPSAQPAQARSPSTRASASLPHRSQITRTSTILQ